MVEGIPSVETWKDKEGEPRAQMVVTAETVRFLGSRPEEASYRDDESE